MSHEGRTSGGTVMCTITELATAACAAIGHLGGVALDVLSQEPSDENEPFLQHSRALSHPDVSGDSGVTTAESVEMERLKRENSKLKRASAILYAASMSSTSRSSRR